MFKGAWAWSRQLSGGANGGLQGWAVCRVLQEDGGCSGAGSSPHTGCGAVCLSVCLMDGVCYILVSMYHRALRKTVSLGLDEETEVQRCCNTLRVSGSTISERARLELQEDSVVWLSAVCSHKH